MKIVRDEVNINIFNLMLRDGALVFEGLDEDALLDTVNFHVKREFYGAEFLGGGDRSHWILKLEMQDKEILFDKRCETREELRDYLPDEILLTLSKINDMTVTLVGGWYDWEKEKTLC